MAAQREATGEKLGRPTTLGRGATLGFRRPHSTGKHTGPRREQPQFGDAKYNPGRYDLWRQGARRLLALAATLIRHRTSEKNCSNSPRNSSCGPSLPSLMIGVAT